MASPFQRHYPPVPLRHCYTLERVYTAPTCHLRTHYPLVEQIASTEPTSNSGSLEVNRDDSAQGNDDAREASVTPSEELEVEQILTQMPNHLREQLGLSADVIVRLRNHLKVVVPQHLRHKQPPSKQKAKIEELHGQASLDLRAPIT
ncbi:hypothetical protein BKA70DRAFT_1445103 [Coprinopsis sp. MPI-PUGE-AT-0042]|nr:hypothetical protein BKA70DRAFT_1445103 [Coprinopsis sp. MPI-PUGE-AT-0042]